MRRPKFDFQKCADCRARYPRSSSSCPSCGRHAFGVRELARQPALITASTPALLATMLVVIMPTGHLVGASLLAAGFSPLIWFMSRLLWRHRRRASGSFAARIAHLEDRLTELDHDLCGTEQRLRDAKTELQDEAAHRASLAIAREVDQDERLRRAQRRLAKELEDRLERLQIEQLRTELLYFEACRDARVEETEPIDELESRIEALELALDGDSSPRWQLVLQDARSLYRQLSRGVERYHAAARLDPLAHAELSGDDYEDELALLEENELEEHTELHLERIERGFDALEELAANLSSDPDASGVRLLVDDDVMAQLESEEVEVAREPGQRTSVI